MLVLVIFSFVSNFVFLKFFPGTHISGPNLVGSQKRKARKECITRRTPGSEASMKGTVAPIGYFVLRSAVG